MSKSKEPISRKLVAVGDGSVGKTCVLSVQHKNEFPENYTPTVCEGFVTYVTVDDKLVELQVWDTAGQEPFNELRPLSYQHASVILLCFSVDNRQSLENVKERWFPELQKHCPEVPIILVGNKKDLREDSDWRNSIIENIENIGIDDDKISVHANKTFATSKTNHDLSLNPFMKQPLDKKPSVMSNISISQLPPFITYEEGVKVSKRINAETYLECSAKEKDGVDLVFLEATRVALRNHESKPYKTYCNIL